MEYRPRGHAINDAFLHDPPGCSVMGMMSLVINTGCSCNPCLAASSSAFAHVHISIPTAFLPIFVFLLRISLQGLAWLDCCGSSLGEELVSLKKCSATSLGGFVYLKVSICLKWIRSSIRSRIPSFTPLGQHPRNRNLQGSLITCLVLCPAEIASRLGLLEGGAHYCPRGDCAHAWIWVWDNPSCDL